MGILKNTATNNALTNIGFTFEYRSVTGELKNCYEKTIKLSDLYYMWVSVNIETSAVVLYIEYDCGGEVATYKFTIDYDFNENPDEFITKLDDEVTDYAKMYE